MGTVGAEESWEYRSDVIANDTMLVSQRTVCVWERGDMGKEEESRDAHMQRYIIIIFPISIIDKCSMNFAH